jgi:hypothetical protein
MGRTKFLGRDHITLPKYLKDQGYTTLSNGKRVDYAPDMVLNSPYLQSTYNSGIVNIRKGEEEMVLDFN